MPQDIRTIAKGYLELNKNQKDAAEITALLEINDVKALNDRLSTRMAFGTAGLRAPMGAGYSRMNDLTVIQASQGLCKYLLETNPKVHSQGVVVGHDHRHNSEQFARLTAAAFLHENIKVYYYERLVHTPLVPFGVTQLGAAAGIMITASHNPKEDNGYKVYWSNGSQIIPPHDKGIAEKIEQNLVPWTWDNTLVKTSPLCTDPAESMIAAYFGSVATLSVSKATNDAPDFPICYTAMHGVGYIYAKKSAEVFGLAPLVPTPEQVEPDPEFPTVKFPNPEEGKGALALAMKAADASGARVILANDPDEEAPSLRGFGGHGNAHAASAEHGDLGSGVTMEPGNVEGAEREREGESNGVRNGLEVFGGGDIF
ncbi:hypothetical protein BDK51DRAFT_33316, partial [Blyttiomyces helicus]